MATSRDQLVAAWVDYTKAYALYPPTNIRVQACLGRYFELLSQVMDGRPSLTIAFEEGHAIVNGTHPVELDPARLDWITERLDRSRLAGVEFFASIAEEAMGAFTEALLAKFGRKNATETFEEMWPETFPGLHLIERTFEGLFLGEGKGAGSGVANTLTAEARAVADVLDQATDVRARVQAIESSIRSATGVDTPAEGGVSVDLIGQIASLLPAEAFDDSSKLLKLTCTILDVLERVLEQSDLSQASPNHLERLMLSISRKYFHAEPNELQVEFSQPDEDSIRVDSTTATHHPDDDIHEDREALLLEIDSLPIEPVRLDPNDPQLADEQAGVYLHYLLQSDSEHAARHIYHVLEGLLVEAEQAAELLGRYLGKAESIADTTLDREPLDRMITFLERSRLTHLARAANFVTEERVEFEFPRLFLVYLDSLDMTVPADRAALSTLCAKVGEKKLLEAAPHFQSCGGLAAFDREQKIFANPSSECLPLVKLIVRDSGAIHKNELTKYLAELKLPDHEACLLRIVEHLPELPFAYVEGLLEKDVDGCYPDKLHHMIAETLCDFIQGTAFNKDLTSVRVYAVSMLKHFRTPRARKVLKAVLRGRRWLGIVREPDTVREAAAISLSVFAGGA